VPIEDVGILPVEREESFRRTGEWVGHWVKEQAPVEWNADPIKVLELKEFRETLDVCLAAHPPRLSQVFVLREIEEMDAEEICRKLNISESNLWEMLHRARMQLRRSLEVKYFKKR
jgi:RNA polymerase sigma-70 factor (ECF subfamily)